VNPSPVSTETLQLCRDVASRASNAKNPLRKLDARGRTEILRLIASAIRRDAPSILRENQKDLEASSTLSDALKDRLRLDPSRISAMAEAVDRIALQPDPLGSNVEERTLPSGIHLQKRRVPIGVILVIYESRPNVTCDAAALCFKAGNAVILRGGKESAHSNRAIVASIQSVLGTIGLSDAVGFVDSPDRSAIDALVQMDGIIDLAIPRGGPALMKAVTHSATIPVVKHDAGNCHIYIDQHLTGLESKAVDIILNAKTQRPGVCNAVETVLVHSRVAPLIIPRLIEALSRAGVEIRGDARTQSLAPGIILATESDWATEYLALILAVRIVDSLDEACLHIRTYGSQHTEAIITTDQHEADRFIAEVESASVMINCSTRFADGGEYGLGAEIGISTSKLHARGPMGAQDLTTYQWVARGSGQIRS